MSRTWYRRTVLEDLWSVTVQQVHTRWLYEGLDALLPHQEVIAKHLGESRRANERGDTTL